MKPRDSIETHKLRGGFYTPPALVHHCLDRVQALRTSCGPLRILEPSVGDGAFIRGLRDHSGEGLTGDGVSVTALELVETEAKKAEHALMDGSFQGKVVVDSALSWRLHTGEQFDVALGNPPFVRYQFVSKQDRAASDTLAERWGVSVPGVANLWISVLLSALSSLRVGGVFAFVVPTELLTGHSARTVRSWLIERTAELTIDLFPPNSFPGVLQEVAVLSGRATSKRSAVRALTVRETHLDGHVSRKRHHARLDAPSWTRYLLEPNLLEAVDAATKTPAVVRLNDVARFEVSIVTGANQFFTCDDTTRGNYQLEPWTRPLLPRVRHAKGIEYRFADHAEMRRRGGRGWLLDLKGHEAAADDHTGLRQYLDGGARRAIPDRYKCRVRSPWFVVPNVVAGSMLLSKRSHEYPRLILNRVGAFTTDTIYRGELRPGTRLTPSALVASFHNSLTLTTAELEGRSFGGGVLELVPSELGRIVVPLAPRMGALLKSLDAICRTGDADSLVEQTDEVLVEQGVMARETVECLAEARRILSHRRFDRNRRNALGAEAGSLERAA